MAFGLLTDETFFLEETSCHQPLAQYVCAIIYHGLGYIIVDIANQLSLAYRGLALELRLFITSSTNITKATDFICTFKEKE